MKKAMFWVLAFILLAGLLPHTALSANAAPGDTYTLVFNENGGSWPNWPPPVETVECDYDHPLSQYRPELPGFYLHSWDDNYGNWYYSNNTIPGGTYDNGDVVTLTANWWQYRITYNANGGNNAPPMQIKPHGYSTHLNSVPPVYSGHNFLYWATNSNGTGDHYEPGDVFTDDKDVTLYAVWGPVSNYYVVNYNANGGSGAPAPQTKQHNEDLTLSSTEPTRSGYVFLGWATSPNATNPQYQSSGTGGTYTTNADLTLYAVWVPDGIPRYTVTYDANGGSGAPSQQTKVHDVALTLSSTTPSRSRYTFLGWATSASASSAQYQAGGSLAANVNENVTLFAVWERGSSSSSGSDNDDGDYTITYDANGGRGEPDPQTKIHDESLTLSGRRPTRSGYEFEGWAYNRRDTQADFRPGSIYRYNEDAVLYAVWIPEDIEYRPTETRIPANYSSGGGTSNTLPKTGGLFPTIRLMIVFGLFLIIIVCVLSRKRIKGLFSR